MADTVAAPAGQEARAEYGVDRPAEGCSLANLSQPASDRFDIPAVSHSGKYPVAGVGLRRVR